MQRWQKGKRVQFRDNFEERLLHEGKTQQRKFYQSSTRTKLANHFEKEKQTKQKKHPVVSFPEPSKTSLHLKGCFPTVYIPSLEGNIGATLNLKGSILEYFLQCTAKNINFFKGNFLQPEGIDPFT